MPDFHARNDSVNVEQIMEQIRARIREKRGVDYEEQQVQELAKSKLEQLLDPRGVQSDVLDRLKKLQPSYEAPQLPSYEFEDSTMFDSTRGSLRFIRRMLNPILKLFFNPNPLIGALHTQTRLNAMYAEREAKRDAMRLAGEQLYYQVLHNLLIEMTRTGLELKNLRMRLESIGSRLELNERRARALESAVAFPASGETRGERPPRPSSSVPPVPYPAAQQAAPSSAPGAAQQGGQGQPAEGSGQRSRRRRRRRGRRGGGHGAATTDAAAAVPAGKVPGAAAAETTSPKDDLANFAGAASHPSESEILPSAGSPESDDTQ